MSDFKKIVEGNLQYFLDYFDTRPLDFNTDKYERNIVFLGCSLTYGQGVENQDTYPSKVQQLSDNKWNCLNFGIRGGSVDLAYIIYNKVIKELDIDCVVIQWPSFYRRAYFEDKEYQPYYPTLSEDDMKLSGDFARISDLDYCVMRNLSNLQVINSFKKVYNLSPQIGHERTDLFKKYGIDNILDFNFHYSTSDYYRVGNGNDHPNKLWYGEYAEYLFRQIL